jgi:uncharacterized protein YbgA (DUF1722 family)
MNTFTNEFLDNLDSIDGFIFKGLSPSMGPEEVKVYAGTNMAPVVERSAGLFAKEVITRYAGYPIEENERLRNYHIRHHFLTQLYTFATFRRTKTEYSQGALLKFHKDNSFLFTSYDMTVFEQMSELLNQNIGTSQKIVEYNSLLRRLMKKPGNLALKMDTARNMSSVFEVTPTENSFFEAMLERFSSNRISWDAVTEVLRMLASRSIGDDSYENTFLYPYPEELKAIVDDKREKDYWIRDNVKVKPVSNSKAHI